MGKLSKSQVSVLASMKESKKPLKFSSLYRWNFSAAERLEEAGFIIINSDDLMFLTDAGRAALTSEQDK